MTQDLPKAILRLEKLKTMGNIGGSLSHNYRTRLTLNADKERTHLNEHILETNQECMDAIRARIPKNKRADAVLCIEHLITASPEWEGWGTKKENEFFATSLNWLKKKYGEANVINATIHRDETTPHMAAYVVPLDEETGRLNAKKWLGGSRLTLSKIQTDFHNEVKHLGLERGLEGSKAEHTTLKEFYSMVKRPTEIVDLNKAHFKASYEDSKIHALDSLSLKNEKLQRYVNHIIDEVFKNYSTQSKDVQTVWEAKLTDQIIKTEKEKKSHKKAVTEIKKLETKFLKLKDEFANLVEHKKLFPEKFKEVELRLKREIDDYEREIERERHRQQYFAEQEAREQIRFEQEARQELLRKIETESTQAFDGFLKTMELKLESAANDEESAAIKAVIAEIEKHRDIGFDPRLVFKLGKEEPKSNLYFALLSGLAHSTNGDELKEVIRVSTGWLEDSKERKFDDYYKSFGADYFPDTFDRTVPYILASEKLLAYKLVKNGDREHLEAARELKTLLGESLLAKGETFYKSVLEDVQHTKARELAKLARNEKINSLNTPDSRPQQKKDRGFEI